MRIFGIHIDPG